MTVLEVAQGPMSKGSRVWDDTNMEKDTLPLMTFVSPWTGTEYTIEAESKWRMAGGFMERCPMYRVDYTQFNILLNGKRVQFALSEEQIPDQVRHFEQPGWDGWTSSPRD